MDVAELWEVEPESLTDAELTAYLRELDTVRSRSEAAMARAAVVWDARKAWADDGATPTTAWLAYRCELSRSSAAVMVRTARRLGSMPVTRRANESGELCFAKVVLLASAAHRSEVTLEVFARDEAILVEHACRLTVDETAQMLRHWLLRADPDREQRERGEGDRLHVSSTFDGVTVLDGVYTSDDGAVVKAAVDAEYERLWRAERASGGPTRTPAQRRAAALAEVIRRAVGAEPGRPTISVTISLGDLERGAGSGSVDSSGEPVCVQAARRLACDARIVPVVLGKASEPLDVGRAARSHTGSATSARHPKPRLRVRWLRSSTELVRRPPHRALGRRRHDRPRQSGVALQPPPQGNARGRLVDGPGARRHPHLHAARWRTTTTRTRRRPRSPCL